MADSTPPQARRGQPDVTVLDLRDTPVPPAAGYRTGAVVGPRPGSDRRSRLGRGSLPGKLRPGPAVSRQLSATLRDLVAPQPGSLVLVHAAAGYGKTTALAATQEPAWLWYNLDAGDRDPFRLASRLSSVLSVAPPGPELAAHGDRMALELADCLYGRSLTITFDRCERLTDAPEAGALLSELLVQLPGLCLRLATRTRPPLPLERLRLEGRLVEVGPNELRLDRSQIAELVFDKWGRKPRASELELADSMLAGWPAALHLWLAETDGADDPTLPLQPGSRLRDYLEEEVLARTLGRDMLRQLRANLAWLVGPGPIWERASTPERRRTIEPLVRNRVGVVPGAGGWHLHPLFESLLVGDAISPPDQTELEVTPADPAADGPIAARSPVVIRAFGGLSVVVDQVPIAANGWPAAARRLLELLLSLPGNQATAQQAAQLLWPAHLSRSALNSFNVALHGLRRMLEPDLTAGAESRFVVRLGAIYRLRLDDITYDVDDFSRLARQVPRPLPDEAAHHLQAAIALYRGDFLASSAEGFVQQKRARLRSVMLDTLERLGEWYAAAGHGGSALHAFGRVLELAPHREHVWGRLLELHLAAGDEYGALAALHQCEQSLDAAGIEPSDFLEDLRWRIRRGKRGS
jgi:DNA-binding SARP family transcriptional activator